jgi:hypothetical protein
MTAIVKGVLTTIKRLKAGQRRELLDELLASKLLSKDQQDALVIESRRGGPTRPLSSFVGDMKKQGRMR